MKLWTVKISLSPSVNKCSFNFNFKFTAVLELAESRQFQQSLIIWNGPQAWFFLLTRSLINKKGGRIGPLLLGGCFVLASSTMLWFSSSIRSPQFWGSYVLWVSLSFTTGIVVSSFNPKNNLKARLDLQVMGIRSELHPINLQNKLYIPLACFTMSTTEKSYMITILKKCESARWICL